jgi:TRAP-type C4-dicarboxylate transport system substrate-binding protein
METPAARTKNLGVLLVLLMLSALTLLTPARAQGQTRIRLATLLPRGSSQYHTLEEMGQQWRTISNGGITLTIYPDGTMGSEQDAVRRMRIGQIQAATLSVGGLSEIDPSVGALQKIPMLYRSLDEVQFVRSRMRPELEQRLEQKGFVVLFWGDVGWVNVFSRQPALRPEEFKKTKVFVGATDNDEIAIMKSIGFQVVPLEWSDVLTSLQTGLVDTVPTVPILALAGQYDLVAKHMLELNYVPLVGATVITKKAWDEIAVEKREALLKVASDAGAQMQTKNRAESKEAVEAMKKRGLQVHPLTPELENEWRQFLESSYPKIRGTMVPADVFDKVRGLLAEYRASGGQPKNEQ